MPALQGNRGSSSAVGDGDELEDPFVQNIFVLRHGEEETGDGAWDPPLSERGKLQAWRVGRNFRMEEWNITRVVVSPFVRCVQTAAEVIAGLCLRPSSVEARGHGFASSSSPPSIKASIECGLAELMNRQARPWLPLPEDGEVKTPDLDSLYALLPQEFHDVLIHSSRQTLSSYREIEETQADADAQCSYISTLQKIADKFHTENILCITHGEGVMHSASMMWPHVEIHEVNYCAYAHAQRPNFKRGGIRSASLIQDDKLILSGEWELITESGSVSGILFCPC